MMKARMLFAAFSLGLMASCAQMTLSEAPQTESVPAIAQNARMPSDHLALTRHYENTAREMGNKAEEQKRLLKHYDEKSYLYGRQAQDLKSHAAALVRKYNEVMAENIREAAAHRQLALEQIRRDKVTRDGWTVRSATARKAGQESN
jgi:hypothetical protein